MLIRAILSDCARKNLWNGNGAKYDSALRCAPHSSSPLDECQDLWIGMALDLITVQADNYLVPHSQIHILHQTTVRTEKTAECVALSVFWS